MATLKKQNDEKPQQEQNPNDIPWHKISAISKEEICDYVRSFYDSIRYQSGKLPIINVKSGADIAESVKLSHNITIPPSIIATIDSAISEGHLKPNTTHEIICSSINHIKNNGFSWKMEGNPPGIHSSFVKNFNHNSSGDIYIKSSSNSNAPIYEAFINIDSNPKFLGKETSFNSIKFRIEQFSTCVYIRDKLNETIQLSKESKLKKDKSDFCLEL